jgi:hypothetical protein
MHFSFSMMKKKDRSWSLWQRLRSSICMASWAKSLALAQIAAL